VTSALRLGYACQWGPSWALIPDRLRAALAAVDGIALTDLPTQLPKRLQSFAWLTSRLAGHPEGWQVGRVNEALNAAKLRLGTRSHELDVVLQIGSVGLVRPPSFVYTDAPVHLLARLVADGAVAPAFLGYGDPAMAISSRRLARERRILGASAGLFTWSEWARRAVVDAGVLPSERVHVVGAGRNLGSPGPPPRRATDTARHRVLFVGRDFGRKGGDLVVDAVVRLRARGHPVTLTVAGPETWPLSTAVPDGVRFAGRVPSDDATIFDEHDLFLMPSRFEAFGIVFLEAQARGLPCIGRNRDAMPELIEEGVTGHLVDGDDADGLASLIEQTLADDAMYARCDERADSIGQATTWGAVAARMVGIMKDQLGGVSPG
jgi:glycosyltransferase involved in cell wall biosynthesis